MALEGGERMGQVLSKGSNAPLGVPQVIVEVSSSSLVDLAALLVTATGKVRNDDDFIFYNHPNGPGVRLRPPSTLDIDLAGVPADIEKIVLTASLDGSGPASFGSAGQVAVAVRGGGGEDLASFAPTGLGPETALLLVEVYRRQGAWKVRAVGQGYASGLAGIATDFGISVDDSPTPAASAPTPPPPPARTPPPAPQQQWAPPPPPPQQQWGPPPPPPQQQWGPPPPPQQQPQQWGPPAAAPPTPAPAGGGMVNLDKGRVSLQKGQSVSLTKTGAAPLTKVRMGLGWDVGYGEDIDLDASCILYDDRRKDVDKVWFMSKKGARGAVRHSGDNLTGAGEGDDEVINVDLAALPPNVTSLVFTVNSFQGQRFTAVRNAFCRLIDDNTNQELVRFDLSESKPQTGLVMCKVQRGQQGWVMTAIGEFHDGKTVRAMVDPAKQYL
jgi:stress response protein SCP2